MIKRTDLPKIAITFAMLTIAFSSSEAKKTQHKNIDTILKRYNFIADFTLKKPTRDNSKYLFLKYPFFTSDKKFKIEKIEANQIAEIPAIIGEGRLVEHINYARVLMINKKYDRAINVLLTAKLKLDFKSLYYRRINYMIGLCQTMVRQALQEKQQKGDGTLSPADKETLKMATYNAHKFLNLAYFGSIRSQHEGEDKKSSWVDKHAGQSYYNLAVNFFNDKNYTYAYEVASEGIDYLKLKNENPYKQKLRQILAETYLHGREYQRAVAEYDKLIRLKPRIELLGSYFSRIADIYFALNNYEIAEELYGHAAAIESDIFRIDSSSLILRAESLFWLGKFDLAEQVMRYALADISLSDPSMPYPRKYIANAKLRYADILLALERTREAAIEYSRVIHDHPHSEAKTFAEVSLACLDLPYFKGNNIGHARAQLSSLLKTTIPVEAKELAQSCLVSSYSQRERTLEMVNKVRNFYERYPYSRFLARFISPVKETHKSRIYEYYEKSEFTKVTTFYEQNKKVLYKALPAKLKRILFHSYVENSRVKDAAEFFDKSYLDSESMEWNIILATFLTESITEISPAYSGLNRKVAEHIKSIMDNKAMLTELNNRYSTHIYRIKTRDAGDRHLPWIYPIYLSWARDDPLRYLCIDIYSILSRMKENRNNIPKVKAELSAIMDQKFPELFEISTECARSFMDLELALYAEKPLTIFKLYGSRNTWPLNTEVIEVLYTIAELNFVAGNNSQAETLFKKISKLNDQLPEVSYARQRLDKSKTEIEKIWN